MVKAAIYGRKTLNDLLLSAAGTNPGEGVGFVQPGGDIFFTSYSDLLIRAKILEHKHRMATVHTEIFTASGLLATEGTVTYYVFPEEVARKRYNYPGAERFYDE